MLIAILILEIFILLFIITLGQGMNERINELEAKLEEKSTKH
jgi:hypothetical protein